MWNGCAQTTVEQPAAEVYGLGEFRVQGCRG